jgi:hypothetical protein
MVAGSRSVPSPDPMPLYWALRPEIGTRANVLSSGNTACLPDPPADILEIHVNAVRTGSSQWGLKIGGAVIDGSIEPELIL